MGQTFLGLGMNQNLCTMLIIFCLALATKGICMQRCQVNSTRKLFHRGAENTTASTIETTHDFLTDEMDDCCSICRESLLEPACFNYQIPPGITLAPGTPTGFTTSCEHNFHTDCILAWIVDQHGNLTRDRGCPMCRNYEAMQIVYDSFVRTSLHREKVCAIHTALWFIAYGFLVFWADYFTCFRKDR